MADCCEKDDAIEALRLRQGSTLKIVLLINAIMFAVGIGAGVYAGSAAVLTDSLDNLGDALTYGLSLYAVRRTAGAKARVALFKGGLILVAAFIVLAQLIYKVMVPEVPIFEVMGAMSVAALAGNSVCLFLLTRHRDDDVNMSSVWECSRNDIASNLSVFFAAILVWLTNAGWPDLIIAFGLMVLLIRSALRVLRNAAGELRAANAARSL